LGKDRAMNRNRLFSLRHNRHQKIPNLARLSL